MQRDTDKAHTFRVHFHDGTSRDIEAPNSLIAEGRARKLNPGAFVKKIKLVREAKAHG